MRPLLAACSALGVILLALTIRDSPAEAHNLNDLWLWAQHSGKCMRASGSGSGALVYQWECTAQGVTRIDLDIVHTSDGWHQIKFRATGKCLEVSNGSTGDGVNLVQNTCDTTKNHQKFTIPGAFGSPAQVQAKHSLKCLDVSSYWIGDAAPIIQWPCNGQPNQKWLMDNHVNEKLRWPDRWFYRLSDSGSYNTWMTLLTHRHVGSGFAANWNSPITDALGDWNDPAQSTNTVYFTEVSPSSTDDVHIAVTNDCYTDFGVTKCTQNAFGITQLFDEAKHECVPPQRPAGDCDSQHSRPDTWWYALVLLDDDVHSGPIYGTHFQRQATVAHELGHTISLAHEAVFNNECDLPHSVMDYECLDFEVLNNPQPFDSCGVNHAYYDPNWGWSGC